MKFHKIKRVNYQFIKKLDFLNLYPKKSFLKALTFYILGWISILFIFLSLITYFWFKKIYIGQNQFSNSIFSDSLKFLEINTKENFYFHLKSKSNSSIIFESRISIKKLKNLQTICLIPKFKNFRISNLKNCSKLNKGIELSIIDNIINLNEMKKVFNCKKMKNCFKYCRKFGELKKKKNKTFCKKKVLNININFDLDKKNNTNFFIKNNFEDSKYPHAKEKNFLKIKMNFLIKPTESKEKFLNLIMLSKYLFGIGIIILISLEIKLFHWRNSRINISEEEKKRLIILNLEKKHSI